MVIKKKGKQLRKMGYFKLCFLLITVSSLGADTLYQNEDIVDTILSEENNYQNENVNSSIKNNKETNENIEVKENSNLDTNNIPTFCSFYFRYLFGFAYTDFTDFHSGYIDDEHFGPSQRYMFKIGTYGCHGWGMELGFSYLNSKRSYTVEGFDSLLIEDVEFHKIMICADGYLRAPRYRRINFNLIFGATGDFGLSERDCKTLDGSRKPYAYFTSYYGYGIGVWIGGRILARISKRIELSFDIGYGITTGTDLHRLLIITWDDINGWPRSQAYQSIHTLIGISFLVINRTDGGWRE